ncbi:MAG: putative aminohydrolase SsnA [Ignavibacteriae bacterium]|nr:putative aminohydrolase SsnA [Ignavibacteriota bacterium]
MLLKNASVLLFSPSRVERVDLRIERGYIIARARNLRSRGSEQVIDLTGKFIMPGMVNAHTHLYSALARGMSAPKQSPKNFVDILRKIWWKLDEALDEESIYYSALVGSIEAVKCGTTLLIDHHASPNCIKGSIDIIKQAMSDVGLRGILCYETTDRGGKKKRDAGLEENERFVSKNLEDSLFRGTIGAHASFTLNDGSMQMIGELAAKHDCGVHIHVAEDEADVLDAAKRATRVRHPERSPDDSQSGRSRRVSILDRFEKHGILTAKSIFAHGVHLSKQDCARIENTGSWLIHNPRSNMNNAVGYAPLNWFGSHSALGTDGFPADMFEESKIGFFRNQESEHKVGFNRIPEMLQAGQRLSSDFFEREFGTLSVGSPADLIVLDYAPPTPLTQDNLPGHFVFGMNSRMAIHTMVNGQWIMFNGQLVGVDEEKVMGEARKAAGRLWRRMT